MTTIPNGSAAQPTTQAEIEIEEYIEPVAPAAAAYVELLNEPPVQKTQHSLGKSRFRTKKLVSSAAIFLSLLLILGAIYMHVKQKDHFGRFNFNWDNDEEELPTPHFNETMSGTVAAQTQESLDSFCLNCIAFTRTLNKAVNCGDSQCGIYGISKLYWMDALRFLDATSVMETHDYESCVADVDCGSVIVVGYMERYSNDCNRDGVIDCQDYIMLHILGPTGCTTGQMPDVYRRRMNECLDGM